MDDDVRTYTCFTVGNPSHDDTALVARIARSYRLAMNDHCGAGASMWATFEGHKVEVARALLADDVETAARLLRDPASNMFFYGFDSLFCEYTKTLKEDPEANANLVGVLKTGITRLATGIGAVRLHNPETGRPPDDTSTDALLDAIDTALGRRIDFPNPFPNEFGLASARGAISYRPLQAIYQASLLREELGFVGGGRVLEIGAGLGRTAYYAYRLGIGDYTIADLPITCAAQAYYLGRTLGDERICLHGERAMPGKIRIIPPEVLFQERPRFNVVLNVDSMTEMEQSFAERYIGYAHDRASALISINHEINPFTVHDLMMQLGIPHTRRPYWMRDGYVEETARFA